MERTYTIYITEIKGYVDDWFEDKNFGSIGKDKAFDRVSVLTNSGILAHVVKKTITETILETK